MSPTRISPARVGRARKRMINGTSTIEVSFTTRRPWHAGASDRIHQRRLDHAWSPQDFRAGRKLLGAADIAGGRIIRAVSKREKVWTNWILN